MSRRYRLFLLINFVLVAGNDYCREGTYGNNCQNTCPEQCRPLQTFPCNKETGKCAEGCNSGYYGDQCDKQCSCPSGICYQANGDCYGTGTTTDQSTQHSVNRTWSTTEATVHTPVCDGVSTGWRTAAEFLIVIIILLACCGIMMFLLRRRWMKQGNIHRANDLLLLEKYETEAEEDQEETPLDDLPVANLEVARPSTEIQENEKIKELEHEKRRLADKCKQLEGELSKYDYQDTEIQKFLGLTSVLTKSTNHLMTNKRLNKDNWLHCPQLKFEKTKSRKIKPTVTQNGTLLSNRDPLGHTAKFYVAACFPSITQRGYHQYFETYSTINLKQEVGEGEVLIQLGFCDEKYMSQFPSNTNTGIDLKVLGHNKDKKICLQSIQGGTIEKKEEQLMENTEGSKAKVNIGIHLNRDMKTLRVFDLESLKLLLKTESMNMNALCPMVGLGGDDKAKITVKLRTGRDITMNERKKNMILSKDIEQTHV